MSNRRDRISTAYSNTHWLWIDMIKITLKPLWSCQLTTEQQLFLYLSDEYDWWNLCLWNRDVFLRIRWDCRVCVFWSL